VPKEAANAPQRFWGTTIAVLFRPTRFYRTLATRADRTRSRQFARVYRTLTAVLLGWTGSLQLLWILGLIVSAGTSTWPRLIPGLSSAGPTGSGLILVLSAFLPCCLLVYLILIGVAHLAARLTAWEARHRNLRLPYQVALRGLDYHSAHYLPVAIVAWLTVGGYRLLLITAVLDDGSGPSYLFLLCAEVLLAAAYLFKTYWTAMRNMMFANR
jgi:hypothetical protein